MIKPTVGRIVHYIPDRQSGRYEGMDLSPDQPFMGMVTYVHNDRLVNLHVLDHDGLPVSEVNVVHHYGGRLSVTLVQEGDAIPTNGAYCQWMQYQVQQAARHDVRATVEAQGKVGSGATPGVEVQRGMSFGGAIEAMKAGAKVCRRGWNGKDMFIVIMPALYLPPYNTQDTNRKVNDRTAKWIGEDQPLDCQPYIAMYNAQKQWIPGWVASQSDILCSDWEVVA